MQYRTNESVRAYQTAGKKPADSLLKHMVIAAHDPKSGMVDAERFADVVGISLQEMAKILDRTTRGLAKNPAAPGLQERLTRLVSIYVTLLDMFERSEKYVRIWLRAPHPDLGGRTPVSCIEEGQQDVVESLVRAMESGQTA